MSDGGTTGRAREASVSDECHVLIQSHTGDRRGGRQHLTHTGAACGAFVTNDHHVALDDLAGVDGGNGFFLALVYLGGTFMHKHFGCHGASLDHAAVGCQISAKNRDTAGLREGIVHRANNLGVAIERIRDILRHGLARHRHDRGVKQTQLVDFFEHRVHAARLIKILHVGGACGCQMAQIGGLFADLVDHIQIEFHAALVGDGGKVKHTVGGTAQRHIRGDGVLDRRRRHDIAGSDVLFHKLHDLHTRVLSQLDSRRIDCGNGAVAAKTHTENLGQAVHGICGVHTRAGAAGGASLVFKFAKLILANGARLVGAHRLEHSGKASLLAVNSARKHGAAADEHGGYIQSCRRHKKPGHVFITVGDHDKAVKAVRHDHSLGGVGDQIARDQGIFHTDVTHGNAVAYRDRGEHNGRSARHGNAQLDRLRDLVQIHMTGNDLVIGADNTDKRSVHLLAGKTQRLIKRTVGRIMGAVYYCIFNHDGFFLCLG